MDSQAAASRQRPSTTGRPVTRQPAVDGDPAEFDPLEPGYLLDPYPTLAGLRAHAPVCYAPKIDMWVVTRYRDVERVLGDPTTFSSANVQAPLRPLRPAAQDILLAGNVRPRPTISSMDPPQHGRLRAPLARAFSARRIAALEPVIQRTTNELITAMLDRGSGADLVAALTWPLPFHVMYRLIGFPPEDADRLRHWGADRLLLTWGRPSVAQQETIARNIVAYRRYCTDFVAHWRQRPGDRHDCVTSDLLDAHEQHPDRLSLDEIASLVYTLSLAGHEAPSHLLANLLRHLLADPARWREVGADPTLIPGAVEEILRYDAANIAWRRITTADCELGGVHLPRGAQLLIVLGAAGRDPEVFADPDRVDPRRSNARAHLAFGRGIHFCVGATLARTQAAVLVRTLAARVPGLRLADDPLRFAPSLAFRGPVELPARW